MKIFRKPVEYLAGPQGITLQAVEPGGVDERRCRLVQLIVQPDSRKRFALKRRAALGRTVDGKMDPRVLELFSQNVVFNLVKSQQLTVDAGDFFLPGGCEETPQVLDGAKARVAGQDQLDGPYVVCVGISLSKLTNTALCFMEISSTISSLHPLASSTIDTMSHPRALKLRMTKIGIFSSATIILLQFMQ